MYCALVVLQWEEPQPSARSGIFFPWIRTRPVTLHVPLHLFRRVSSGAPYVPEIDGLRSLAILAVVVFHSSGYFWVKNLERGSYALVEPAHSLELRWVLSHGFLGVQLFFAISGLVLALPFARSARKNEDPPSFGSYIRRRVTRIEPPYILALCFYAIVTLALLPKSMSPIQYIAGLFYTRNLLFDSGTWLFYVSWSLEIEVQFYLIAPLLSLVYRVDSVIARRCILLIAIALSGYYSAAYRLSAADPGPFGGPLQHGWWLGPELSFFLVGMLVADISTSSRPVVRGRAHSFIWDATWLGGLFLVIDSYRLLEQSAGGIAALLLGLFLITLGALRSWLVRAVLAFPICSAIGGACYTIYLFHTLPVAFFGKILLPLTGTSYERDMLFVAIPMAVVVCAGGLLLFPFVERPFMYRQWPVLVLTSIRSRDPKALLALFRNDDAAAQSHRALRGPPPVSGPVASVDGSTRAGNTPERPR